MDTATAQPENDVNPGFPSYNAIGTVTAEVLKGDGCILLVRACWNEQTYTGILVLDPDRQHQWSNALLLRKAPRMTPPSTPTGSQSQKLPPAVNEPRIYNTRQRARTNRLSLPCFGSEADAIGQSPCAPALEDNSEPFVQPLLPRGTPPVLDSPRVSTGESRIFPLEEHAFVKETRQPNASERSTDNPAQHASGSAVSEAEKQHRPKCLARKLESEFQQGLHSVIMQTAKLCIPENSSLKGDTQTDNTRMYSGSHATKTITEDPEQNNTVRPYRQAEKSLESSCQVAGPITLRKVNSIQQKPLVTSSVSGDRRSLNATPTRSTANTEHTSRPLALEEHEYVIQKDRKSTSSLSPKSPNAIPTKRIADKKKPSRFSIRFRPSLLAGEGPSPADGQSVDFMLETSNLDSEGSSSVNSAASIQSFNQTSAATGGKNPIPVGKRKRRYNKGSYLSPDKIRAKRMQAKRRQARAQTPAGTAQNKEKERTQASGVDTAGPDDCQSNSATSLPCTSQNYDADSQLCFDPTQLKQCSSSESGTPESGISLTGFPSSSVTDTTQGGTSLTGFPSSSVTDTTQGDTSLTGFSWSSVTDTTQGDTSLTGFSWSSVTDTTQGDTSLTGLPSSSVTDTTQGDTSLTGFPSSSVTDTTQGDTSLTGFPSSSVTDTTQGDTSLTGFPSSSVTDTQGDTSLTGFPSSSVIDTTQGDTSLTGFPSSLTQGDTSLTGFPSSSVIDTTQGDTSLTGFPSSSTQGDTSLTGFPSSSVNDTTQGDTSLTGLPSSSVTDTTQGDTSLTGFPSSSVTDTTQGDTSLTGFPSSSVTDTTQGDTSLTGLPSSSTQGDTSLTGFPSSSVTDTTQGDTSLTGFPSSSTQGGTSFTWFSWSSVTDTTQGDTSLTGLPSFSVTDTTQGDTSLTGLPSSSTQGGTSFTWFSWSSVTDTTQGDTSLTGLPSTSVTGTTQGDTSLTGLPSTSVTDTTQGDTLLTGFPSSSVTDTTQGATSLTGFPSSSVTDTKQGGTSRRSSVFERKSQHRAARYGSEDGDGAKPLSAHSATQPSPRLAGTKRKMENTSETVCQQEGTLLTNQEIPERHHNHDKKKGKRTVLS